MARLSAGRVLIHCQTALETSDAAIGLGPCANHFTHRRRQFRVSQYVAIRYTERLADEGAVGSVGSKGDSYDNALAETVNGLYKTELIRQRGPWRTVEDVELATLGWVDWYNQRRLHGACDDLPPAECEAMFTVDRQPHPRRENQPRESPSNPERLRGSCCVDAAQPHPNAEHRGKPTVARQSPPTLSRTRRTPPPRHTAAFSATSASNC